jgi:CRISPR-associated protein Cas2
MFIIVSYDITDDALRGKISNILEDYGTRVQKSVFEVTLDKKLWKTLRYKLQKIYLDEKDSIRVYFICENCLNKIEFFGNLRRAEEPEFYLV